MADQRLIDLTISEVLTGLGNKDFSTVELTESYLAQMEKTRGLNIYVTETPERALEDAKESDQRYQKGEARPLEGIPLANKDLFCTEGLLTKAGSKILNNFVPPYESTVSKNLKEAGTVHLGKVNLDEFAMGSSVLTSFEGPTINPWVSADDKKKKLVPGGSSGGSSAAVAARSALIATGTDTGGSVRQPAAFCGIVGLKPTYGRCSRYGIMAFASSFDQAGPMTRTVRDAALMLEVMAGHDPKESTSADIPVPSYEKMLTGNVKGMKVGIPTEYKSDGLDGSMKQYWEKSAQWLRDAGAEVVDISLPHTKYALPTYYVLATAEASSNLARYDGVRYGFRSPGTSLDEMYENTRGEGFGDEVKRRIMLGTFVLSSGYYDAYYIKGQKVRALIAQDFRKAFEKVDLILTPTTPTPAFSVEGAPQDPLTMYLNDVYTVTANLAGVPAISVPAGLSSDGLPLGLQLFAPAFEEGRMLQAAEVIEQAAAFPKLQDIQIAA